MRLRESVMRSTISSMQTPGFETTKEHKDNFNLQKCFFFTEEKTKHCHQLRRNLFSFFFIKGNTILRMNSSLVFLKLKCFIIGMKFDSLVILRENLTISSPTSVHTQLCSCSGSSTELLRNCSGVAS